MQEAGFEPIIVKVSSMGLDRDNLGQNLWEMREELRVLNRRYGVNVSGEGGEYESLILDGPLL